MFSFNVFFYLFCATYKSIMTTSSDKQIIVTGDEKVIRSIYEKYFTRFTLFAKSILKDEDEAKDVVQTVFSQLWLNKLEFDNIDRLKSYLYFSVKNRCLNILKKNKKYCDLQDVLIDSFDNLMIKEETIAEMLELIDNLPSVKKNLMLDKLKGMTLGDIAKKYNISKKTVSNNISIINKQISRNIVNCFLLVFLRSK